MQPSRVPPGARARVARVTETFFTEIGVLLFVFPVLDEYVQYGQKGVTRQLLFSSLAASFICFSTAATIAAFSQEGQD